jgi:uncharacterized protein (TIGR00299 family) protein
MVLGALLDAGLPLDALRQALGSLGVGHDLQVARVLKAGISATHVTVTGQEEPAHDHHHHHHHGQDHHHGHSHDGQSHAAPAHHVHRSLHDIAHLIDRSHLSDTGKSKAVAMFRRLAEAEAAIHDMPIEEVHLHEVGAVDSIIDIVGAVFALEWFGIDDIEASPLNVGGGTVEMAHGTFPIPAPATLRLLAGVPIYSSGIMAELLTPTGALVVSTYAKRYGPMPSMAVERVGYGAGTRDLGKVPNVLRVVVGERVARDLPADMAASADVIKIECEIDDMSPQLFGPVSDRLLSAGALDVFVTPIIMKKGRPGALLTVLAPPDGRDALCDVLFRETTTIGVRFEQVRRDVLDRVWEDVAIEGGQVRVKVASRRGEVLNAAPEFEDCLRLAAAMGRPVKSIQAEAMRAWHDRKGAGASR